MIGFNSCKRCTSCEVKDSNGNTIQEPTKTCGSASDIDQIKTNKLSWTSTKLERLMGECAVADSTTISCL